MERILIKFTKTGSAKFISHLDTMRTLHRAFRRAGVPISYSKGFNPHPSISVSSPLSLGIESLAEYADVDVEEHIDIRKTMEEMNTTLPDGIKILDIITIPEKMPTSMSAVEGAKYRLTLSSGLSIEELNGIVQKILLRQEIKLMKKTKSGEKLTDVRPLIKDITAAGADGKTAVFECFLLSGSRGNLNPELAAEIIKEASERMITGYPYISRTELYTEKGGKWIDLASFFSGKWQV